MANILSVGKSALNAAKGPVVSYVVPLIIGIIVVAFLVAYIPGAKKIFTA